MPKDVRYRRSLGSRLRFFLRFLGLTGVAVAAVALVVRLAYTTDNSWSSWVAGFRGEAGTNNQLQMYAIVIGLGLAALALLLEILANAGKAAGRRSAVGLNATAQLILASLLLAGVNYLAFVGLPLKVIDEPSTRAGRWLNTAGGLFGQRWDATKNRQFTLPENVQQTLKSFQGSATIVVLQQHKTFGQLSTKPDGYDYAAERKVVEKVRDLVDQLRSLGSRYRVVTLDVEEEGYDRKLEEIAEQNRGLKDAIKSAPENSIFFAAEGKVQRLSFNEFYQLDKAASREANGGKGNLVLRPQGLEAFVNRVLAIEERKPRVGLAVIHEWLTTIESEGSVELYSSQGLRKTLENYGFEVTDIVLKKWGQRQPTPAAYNLEETQYERLESELSLVESDLREIREERKDAKEFLEFIQKASLEELKKQFGRRLPRATFDEEFRRKNVESVQAALEGMAKREEEMTRERGDLQSKLTALLGKERAFEDRRVTDVSAKFRRILADCDMLIIPRMTIFNASGDNDRIPARLHALQKEQAEVIKEFFKAGKPILALVGPASSSSEEPAAETPLDDFERLLVDMGVELGQQTILYDAESKGFAARKSGDLFGGSPQEIPSLRFDAGKAKVPNPVASAMLVTARSVDQVLDIRMRAPRPVYALPGIETKQPFPPEFLFTAAESWNEEAPFTSIRQQGNSVIIATPRFEATRFDDPKKGTRDEERRGPFPVGIAIENRIPIDWVNADYSGYRMLSGVLAGVDQGLTAALFTATAQSIPRPTERLIVFGQGGVFTGRALSPAYEKLLLTSCNWLLGRQDRLPNTQLPEWSYPRVDLSDSQKFLWHWGTFLGLPALFVYLGLIVLMIRKVR